MTSFLARATCPRMLILLRSGDTTTGRAAALSWYVHVGLICGKNVNNLAVLLALTCICHGTALIDCMWKCGCYTWNLESWTFEKVVKQKHHTLWMTCMYLSRFCVLARPVALISNCFNVNFTWCFTWCQLTEIGATPLQCRIIMFSCIRLNYSLFPT